MKKLYAAACLLTLVGFACTKDQEAVPSVPITAQNIAGSYSLISYTSKLASFPEVDLLNTMDDCKLDNEYTFKRDGNFFLIDAGIQCADTSNPSGKWQLINGTTLQVHNDDWTIMTYQGKVLTVSQQAVQNGEPVTITKRYMRIK